MNEICNLDENENSENYENNLSYDESDNEKNNSFNHKIVESIVFNKKNEQELNKQQIEDKNNLNDNDKNIKIKENLDNDNLEEKIKNFNSFNNNENENIINDIHKDINIQKVNNYNFQKIKNENKINNCSIANENICDSKIFKKENINEKNEQNNNDNILGEYSISKAFQKSTGKKEPELFDFENIEVPKESQKGEFTEINCPYILDNKEQEKLDVKKNQENILLNFYNSNNTILKNSVNNSYFNFFKNDKDNFSSIEQLYKTCINLKSNKNDIDIVKIMAVLKSSNNVSWKDNLKSLVSSLFYNGYGLTKKFDIEEPALPLYIFDMKFEDVIKDEINVLLKSYLYMSYRSGFINLNSIGCGDFTSDCGWGCMLRCCQMILSKGLIQRKIFEFFNNRHSFIDNDCIDSIRRQTLALFNDNFLPTKEVKNHPDYKIFWKKYNDLTKTNSEYNSISEIIPPYSLHILTKLGKCAGEYTSDIKNLKLISKINKQLFEEDMNILIFECGFISRKKLIINFCEEYNDFNFNYLDTITYNGVDYIFKKGGLVFISFRWGLSDLDPIFYDVVPLLFKKFHNNLGFVSGKKNRAYYFIGIDKNNKLIFADPHYNQQITNDPDKDYESYYTENLYLLDIKDMSSELTLGIGIFNSVQFTQFFDDLNWFNDNLENLHIITFEKD